MKAGDKNVARFFANKITLMLTNMRVILFLPLCYFEMIETEGPDGAGREVEELPIVTG